jgi:soluble lytic murein transglycosylase
LGRKRNSLKKKRIILYSVLAIVLVAACISAAFISDFIERRKYPLKYEDSIIKYSAQNGIDPYLAAAVINVESGFNPSIRSEKGAIGLMQIMPDTGDWLYEQMGKSGFDPALLREPETNIELGCYYLNYLSQKYGGRQTNFLAAYNAGPGRVDQWLANPSYSSEGETLANIPYKQTNDYVKKVVQAYEKYKTLYPDKLKTTE